MEQITKARAINEAEIICRRKGLIFNYVEIRNGQWVFNATNRRMIPRDYVLKGFTA